MTRRRALLALTALALVATVPIVPGPARAALVMAFVLFGPGLAWTPRLPVHGPVEEATVAVALSPTLAALAATALLQLGVLGLAPALLVLSGITVGGAWLTPAGGAP